MPKDKDPHTTFTLDVEPRPNSLKASLIERLRDRIFGKKEPLEEPNEELNESLERAKLVEAVSSQLKAFDKENGFPRKKDSFDQPMPTVSPEMTKLAELAFNDSLRGQDRALLKGVYDYNQEVIKPMYHGNFPVFAKYGFLNLSAPTCETWYECFSKMVHPL